MSNSWVVVDLGSTTAYCAPLSGRALSAEQAGQSAPLLKALADPVRLRLMSLVASSPGGDAKWLDELLNRPDTTLIPYWRDQCLVSGDPPVPVTLPAARAGGVVFLRLDADGHGVFAADLSGMEAEEAAELAGAGRALDVR